MHFASPGGLWTPLPKQLYAAVGVWFFAQQREKDKSCQLHTDGLGRNAAESSRGERPAVEPDRLLLVAA